MQTRDEKRPGGAPARLRDLPAVSRLLAARPVRRAVRRWGEALVKDLLREALDALRDEVRAGRLEASALRRAVRPGAIAARVERDAATLVAPRPRTVINATGVVVHTNLGRSLLSADAAAEVARQATHYMDLEYDVARGRRGSRLSHLEPLMQRLFPGAGFAVVNNNAAAIMLCLRALAKGKEVVLSRGELVEIGGSFRVPDIMAASGARLREVGTTNRTRVGDYAAAVGKRTGAILKVHTSNFRIVGFTEAVTTESLARLARRHGLPLIVDWGSGDLVDLEPLGIRDELPVRAVLAAGADLVTFSGDKLLGGPQAGFVVGDEALVQRVRRDPLARVCRLDRLMLAALHRTLAAYVRGAAFEEVPTLRMLAATPQAIGRRARGVVREIVARTGGSGGRGRAAEARVPGASRAEPTGRSGDAGRGARLTVVDGVSRPGGGSSPEGERPTKLLAVEVPGGDAAAIERRLRGGAPPIVGRVHEGRLLLDLRTVLPEQDAIVVERLVEALAPVRDEPSRAAP